MCVHMCVGGGKANLLRVHIRHTNRQKSPAIFKVSITRRIHMSCEPWPQTRSITQEEIVFHQPFKFNVYLRVTRGSTQACTCMCTLLYRVTGLSCSDRRLNQLKAPSFYMYIVPSVSQLFFLHPLTTGFCTTQV